MMLYNFAPLWDEALEGLLNDAVEAKESSALKVDDLQDLSLANAIRVGDIMETLFLMTIYGHWIYQDEQGAPQVIEQNAMDALFANARVSVADLSQFSGSWKQEN